MIINNINEMKKGWFIGNFEPSMLKTSSFEVGFKLHEAGEKYGFHYHEKVTEFNLIVEGTMEMHNQELQSGDIFILEPFEVANPKFITNCKIVCIKVPGITNDKIEIVIEQER